MKGRRSSTRRACRQRRGMRATRRRAAPVDPAALAEVRALLGDAPRAARPPDRAPAPHPGPLRLPVRRAPRRARRRDEARDDRGVRGRDVLPPLRRREGRRGRAAARSPCAYARRSRARWRARDALRASCATLAARGRARARRAVHRPLRAGAGGGRRAQRRSATRRRDDVARRGRGKRRRAAPRDLPSTTRTTAPSGGYRRCANASRGKRTLEAVDRGDGELGAARPGRRGLSRRAASGRSCAREPAPRLMAVNIDEGEPGTFKDRYYLERDPHRFLEGMLIAAWAVGIDAIYIYLRDEYAACRAMLDARARGARAPIRRARCRAIHLRRGAGAYICGEESAMIESIEGKRGMPRLRPPYVAQVGLFGRPDARAQHGDAVLGARHPREGRARGSPGRAATAARDCARSRCRDACSKPGVHLAPAGITVRELIDEYCGGMLDGPRVLRLPARRRVGRHPAGIDGRHPARLRHAAAARLLHRLGRGDHPVAARPRARRGAEHDGVLRRRVVRPVHAVPRRHREGRRR